METQTSMLDDATRNSLNERIGEATEHRVRRRDDDNLELRDVVFRGWKLGEGRDGTGGSGSHEWSRGVIATVYLTEGGNLITAVERWTRWEGEYGQALASTHTNAADAYEWFTKPLVDSQSDQRERETMWLKRNVAVWKDPGYRAREDQSRAMAVAIKEAWEEACSTYPTIESDGVERVD